MGNALSQPLNVSHSFNHNINWQGCFGLCDLVSLAVGSNEFAVRERAFCDKAREELIKYARIQNTVHPDPRVISTIILKAYSVWNKEQYGTDFLDVIVQVYGHALQQVLMQNQRMTNTSCDPQVFYKALHSRGLCQFDGCVFYFDGLIKLTVGDIMEKHDLERLSRLPDSIIYLPLLRIFNEKATTGVTLIAERRNFESKTVVASWPDRKALVVSLAFGCLDKNGNSVQIRSDCIVTTEHELWRVVRNMKKDIEKLLQKVVE